MRFCAAGFQLLLLALQRRLLLLMLADLFGQRGELRAQGHTPGEAMTLRAQTFQLRKRLALTAQLVPGLLRTGQAFLSREVFVTQAMQFNQPLLLELQLPLLRLTGLELLLGIVETLFEFSQLFRGQRNDVAGLRGQGFQRFFGFLALAVEIGRASCRERVF